MTGKICRDLIPNRINKKTFWIKVQNSLVYTNIQNVYIVCVGESYFACAIFCRFQKSTAQCRCVIRSDI